MQPDSLESESLDPKLLASAVRAAGGAEHDPETPEGLKALQSLALRLASHPDSIETLAIWKQAKLMVLTASVAPVAPATPRDRRLALTPGGGPQRVEGINIPDRLNVLKRGRSYAPDRSSGNSFDLDN